MASMVVVGLAAVASAAVGAAPTEVAKGASTVGAREVPEAVKVVLGAVRAASAVVAKADTAVPASVLAELAARAWALAGLVVLAQGLAELALVGTGEENTMARGTMEAPMSTAIFPLPGIGTIIMARAMAVAGQPPERPPEWQWEQSLGPCRLRPNLRR